MSTTNLLDAIKIAKENERIASTSYARAAKEVRHPMARQLFTELSKFEEYHFERLTELEASLKEKGDYISYINREMSLPPRFEVKAAEEPGQKSLMTIIAQAITLEEQSKKAYADLAAQTTNPLGKQMFTRLSEEEHNHFLILNQAYWQLTNLGTWTFSQPDA